MKVLLLSTDSQVFNEGSAVRERIKEYGTLVEELHVIVYTRGRSTNCEEQIAKNVFIYPTNTILKPFYFFDAHKIVVSILRKSQDLGSYDVLDIRYLSHWLI